MKGVKRDLANKFGHVVVKKITKIKDVDRGGKLAGDTLRGLRYIFGEIFAVTAKDFGIVKSNRGIGGINNFRLGLIARRENRLFAAIARFWFASKFAPSSALPYVHLFLCYLRLDKVFKAKHYYNLALHINPRYRRRLVAALNAAMMARPDVFEKYSKKSAFAPTGAGGGRLPYGCNADAIDYPPNGGACKGNALKESKLLGVAGKAALQNAGKPIDYSEVAQRVVKKSVIVKFFERATDWLVYSVEYAQKVWEESGGGSFFGRVKGFFLSVFSSVRSVVKNPFAIKPSGPKGFFSAGQDAKGKPHILQEPLEPNVSQKIVRGINFTQPKLEATGLCDRPIEQSDDDLVVDGLGGGSFKPLVPPRVLPTVPTARRGAEGLVRTSQPQKHAPLEPEITPDALPEEVDMDNYLKEKSFMQLQNNGKSPVAVKIRPSSGDAD